VRKLRSKSMRRSVLQRIHNPFNWTCNCDPTCWCNESQLGRAVRWYGNSRVSGRSPRSGIPLIVGGHPLCFVTSSNLMARQSVRAVPRRCSLILRHAHPPPTAKKVAESSLGATVRPRRHQRQHRSARMQAPQAPEGPGLSRIGAIGRGTIQSELRTPRRFRARYDSHLPDQAPTEA
jgi:hypothetical protein